MFQIKIKLTIAFVVTCFAINAQTTLIDSIYSGGLYRNYRLYIPALYVPGEQVPLLLNLHGYGSNAFEQEFYGEFRPIADTANFIIVHPNGTLDPSFPLFPSQFWNCFGTIGTGVDDVAFLSELIDSISSEYSINQNRIYSTGMSNGGFMSYELACRLSNKIAAIASVTGSITDNHLEACDPQHPMPVMEIHGTADFTVPYNGTSTFTSINDVVDYWVNFNNCSPTPTFTEMPDIDGGDASTVEYYVYVGGDNSANVELFKVINGGHSWPGTVFVIGTTNQDIEASTEIWNFFNRYDLSLLTGIQGSVQNEFIEINPNPFTSLLYIEPSATNNKWITIVNAIGQVVLHQNLTNFATTINTQDWPTGVYICQITSKNEVVGTQLIVK